MSLLLKAFISTFSLLCCICAEGACAQDVPISLAVFISDIDITGSSTGGSDSGRPFVEAVDLAVSLVNNDTGLIPGYTLQYELADSQCSAGPSVRRFIDQIFMEPTKIMIVGADCSTSTEPIAELAPFWNLVQISSVSSSPALSRTETYSTFLRLVSSDAAVAEGVVKLMLAFNWTRVAVISQQENIFASIFAQLREDLVEASITDDPREFNFNTNTDPTNVVYRLSNSSTRIILLNVYPSSAEKILCQAYRLGMTQRNGYLWLLLAWYHEGWWVKNDPEEMSCPAAEIEEVLQYSILIDHFASVDEEDRLMPTNSSLTREKFDSIIEERLIGAKDTSVASQAQFYFDAVWAAALALHHVVSGGFNLSHFTYDRNDDVSVGIRDAIFDTTRSLQFLGMSGPVKFNEVGDRYPHLRYFQYRRIEGRISRHIVESLEDSAMFPFGVPQDEEFVYINVALVVVYAILASVGVVIALVCLALNVYFREKKVIKLSSPYLNVLIVCGIVMFYVDVILFGIDEGTASSCAVNTLCMTRLWVASIAFSLLFGTIFAKTWRVYYVFYSSNNHKRSKKTLIQDWVLFLIVGVLVAVDVVFMILVTSFPSSRLTLESTELASNSRDLPQVVGMCRSKDRFIWLSVLFVYKGILLIVGAFLAFEIRNVKIRHLNDSKLIGMSVYGLLVLSVALAAIGILLERFVDAFYAVVGLMVVVGNTSLLGLIFIPKFYSLWKDPEGLKVMGGGMESTTVPSDTKETISQLNQELSRLKLELSRHSSRAPSLPLPSLLEETSTRLSGEDSPPMKTRSERSVSFSEVLTNHRNFDPSTEDSSSVIEVAEVSITFKDE